MIVLAAFFVIVALVPLLSGRLIRMGGLEFSHGWTALLALWIQIPLTTFGAGWLPESINQIIHVSTYGLALAFVWHNRRLVGIPILVVGAMSNLTAILVNGGTMPASKGALELAGIRLSAEQFRNSGLVENPRLGFLGDIFAVPEALPLSNVFSIGDVLLVVGGAVMLHWYCASRLFPKRHVEVTVAEFWERCEAKTARLESDRLEAERFNEILRAPAITPE